MLTVTHLTKIAAARNELFIVTLANGQSFTVRVSRQNRVEKNNITARRFATALHKLINKSLSL